MEAIASNVTRVWLQHGLVYCLGILTGLAVNIILDAIDLKDTPENDLKKV